MRGLFATTALISEKSGGGKVSAHELKALDEFCDEVDYFDLGSTTLERLSSVWQQDQIVADTIKRSYDIAHFNGNPWRETVTKLRRLNPTVKIVSSVPAHDLEESVAEHHRLGINYEQHYPHMIRQWDEFTEHIRESDVVVYPSNYSKDYLVKRMGLTNRAEVIFHGCDLPKDSLESEMFAPQRIFNIGYIGAWGPDKGIKYLVEAWSELDYDDSTLYFFGQGSRDMRAYLVPLATGGKYHLYGGFYDCSEIMQKFCIGVFPSVTEGFGISILECMAWGKPVITTVGAGASELIQYSEQGYVVDIRNSHEIAKAIDYYKTHPDRIMLDGKSAREKSKQFTWDKIEEKYRVVYASI